MANMLLFSFLSTVHLSRIQPFLGSSSWQRWCSLPAHHHRQYVSKSMRVSFSPTWFNKEVIAVALKTSNTSREDGGRKKETHFKTVIRSPNSRGCRFKISWLLNLGFLHSASEQRFFFKHTIIFSTNYTSGLQIQSHRSVSPSIRI